MFLNQKNLRTTLQRIDKTRIIRLVCNRNLHSICALFIFTQILKKELFKYEVEFKNLENEKNFYFNVDEEEFCLSNEAGECKCKGNEIYGVTVLYQAAKSMNFLKPETVWPMAVCFSYYRTIDLKPVTCDTDKENQSNIQPAVCHFCNDLYNEITLSIKILNCKLDGVFIQKRNNLEFLQSSTLFQCIKNDFKFIHEKRLFYNKGAEMKIGEFLARKGISISASNEQYIALNTMNKRLCNETFGESTKFILKSGHDLEISAVEHSFLILFFLYKEKDMYSYTCLHKRKLMDLDKACKFYHKIITLFKEAVLTASRIDDTVVFKIKTEDFTVGQVCILCDILHRLLRIHLKYRNESFKDTALYLQIDKDMCILNTTKPVPLNIQKEEIAPLLIKIKHKDLTDCVRSIKHK